MGWGEAKAMVGDGEERVDDSASGWAGGKGDWGKGMRRARRVDGGVASAETAAS